MAREQVEHVVEAEHQCAPTPRRRGRARGRSGSLRLAVDLRCAWHGSLRMPTRPDPMRPRRRLSADSPCTREASAARSRRRRPRPGRHPIDADPRDPPPERPRDQAGRESARASVGRMWFSGGVVAEHDHRARPGEHAPGRRQLRCDPLGPVADHLDVLGGVGCGAAPRYPTGIGGDEVDSRVMGGGSPRSEPVEAPPMASRASPLGETTSSGESGPCSACASRSRASGSGSADPSRTTISSRARVAVDTDDPAQLGLLHPGAAGTGDHVNGRYRLGSVGQRGDAGRPMA